MNQIKPLKIALLSYRSKPTCGGQGIYISQLSEALTQKGHKVTVISGKPYPKLSKNVKLIKLPGLNLADTFNFFPKPWWKAFSTWPNFLEWCYARCGIFSEPIVFGKRLKQYFKHNSIPYDIVHDNQSLCYECLSLQETIPFVCTIHHPISQDFKIAKQHATTKLEYIGINQWYKFLKMQVYVAPRIRNILTVSKHSQTAIIKDFKVSKNNIKVLRLGIDCKQFHPKKQLQKSLNLLCISSSESPLKGLIILLKALKQLVRRLPSISLTLVGSVNPQGYCASYIKTHCLAKHIKQDQNISQEKLISYYQQAELVIIPSIYEGFGIPALEAMATGTPVVASNTGAIAEIIGPCGLLCQPGDDISLAKNIEMLLNDTKTRLKLGELARKRAVELFSWPKIVSELETYYDDVIKKGP